MKKKYQTLGATTTPEEPRHRVIDFGDKVGKMEFVATDEQTEEILKRFDPNRLGRAMPRR